MTRLFVEQPLALPGSAKNFICSTWIVACIQSALSWLWKEVQDIRKDMPKTLRLANPLYITSWNFQDQGSGYSLDLKYQIPGAGSGRAHGTPGGSLPALPGVAPAARSTWLRSGCPWLGGWQKGRWRLAAAPRSHPGRPLVGLAPEHHMSWTWVWKRSKNSSSTFKPQKFSFCCCQGWGYENRQHSQPKQLPGQSANIPGNFFSIATCFEEVA